MQDTTIKPALNPVPTPASVKPASAAAGAALLCVLSMSSVQFGAALSAPGAGADQLLADADRAMYAAKAAGGGRWRLATGS